jgi:hypothetical protein
MEGYKNGWMWGPSVLWPAWSYMSCYDHNLGLKATRTWNLAFLNASVFFALNLGQYTCQIDGYGWYSINANTESMG